jgi:nucleotide-binding universal stress UspA family protein
MTPVSHILVPTDFSENADAALTYALSLAGQTGAAVTVVHVFDDSDRVSPFLTHYAPMPAEMRGAILADIRGQLSARVVASGHKAVTADVLTGSPAKAIVDGATKHQCDLIVMGTQGRHGVAHVLLGSVAERVVRTAVCPVLVVRQVLAKSSESQLSWDREALHQPTLRGIIPVTA